MSNFTLKAPVEEFELTMFARQVEIGAPPIEKVKAPLVCRTFDQLKRQLW
jgi:hypothetical protein